MRVLGRPIAQRPSSSCCRHDRKLGHKSRLALPAASRAEGSRDRLGPDERQEIRIYGSGFHGGHAVRESFVVFQCAVLQQLCSQRAGVGIGGQSARRRRASLA
jgi:hypothetical protein